MLDLTESSTRRRLAAAGVLALVFAAGLAFAAFENSVGPTVASSLGANEGAAGTVTVVPIEEGDCLYASDTTKAVATTPDNGGVTETARPAGHPSISTDSGGGNSGTSAATPKPGPSPGDAGTVDDSHPDSPHDRDYESSCPRP